MSASAPVADQRVILITGANKGIGYEAVKLLSRQVPNAILLLGCRSVDNGQKAILRMRDEQQQHGGHNFDNVKVVELDVTQTASIASAAAQVKSEYGRLDVLMCNAGVAGGAGESADTVFAVNVDGVHDTIEAFLPHVPASGLIVVVASEVGAWATAALPPQLQKILTSPNTVNWPLIQQLEADWLKAQKEQPHEQPWPPTNKAATGAYAISKALVLAYLRSFALQHAQPKLVTAQHTHTSTTHTQVRVWWPN